MNAFSSLRTLPKFTWVRTILSVSKRDSHKTVYRPSPFGIFSRHLFAIGRTGLFSVKYAAARLSISCSFSIRALRESFDRPRHFRKAGPCPLYELRFAERRGPAYRAIKTNVGDSVNVVVHLERRPGRRFVSEVVEIHGYDPDRDEYNYGFIFDCHKELV